MKYGVVGKRKPNIYPAETINSKHPNVIFPLQNFCRVYYEEWRLFQLFHFDTGDYNK